MTDIKLLCQRAKAASRKMAILGPKAKSKALRSMAKALINRSSYIIGENFKDIENAGKNNMPKALIDRLTLDEKRIKAMADSLTEISKLKDPVGQVMETRSRPNALLIKKVRVCLIVISS